MTIEIDRIVEEAIKTSSNRTELWANLLSHLNCRTVCEVGVWKGEFAQTMLQNVEAIEGYTLIDPWRNLPNWNKPANRSDDVFDEIRAEALERVSPYQSKVREIRETTTKARHMIDDASLDFVYIDGDHTLRGITLDLVSMHPKVRAQGFIGGDDFTKTIWQHSLAYSPTEVFPFAVHFAEAHDLKIYTLPFNQFLIFNASEGFEVRDHGRYADLTPAEIYAPRKQPLLKRLERVARQLAKRALSVFR